MAYKHGVHVSEIPTSILPPVSVNSAIPFIVGAAPIAMADETNVNKPVLVSSYDDAVKAFGYCAPKLDSASGLKKFEYSLSEFMHSQFALFGTGPAIMVNVLDPTKHKKTAETTEVTFDAKTKTAVVQEIGVILSSVTLDAFARDKDYSLAFDSSGHLVITALADGSIDAAASVAFSAEVLDPSAITSEDILGGVDTNGKKSGLELISECFPRFRLVPGLILTPGYDNATIAAAKAAKAANINGHFSALALVDIPTDAVKQYSEAAAWKTNNNVTDPRQIACWPMLSLDGVAFHMSTQIAGVIGKTDADNGGVPYVSPSNHSINATSTILEDGEEVWLSPDTAAYLNGQGIVTGLNFIGGWKCWGNRTATYPSNTDTKDAFIPVRRMFDWVGNTLTQTFWQKLDAPINRRLVESIVDSANIWMNGLVARQYLLGGKVEFLETENPTTDLMDGIIRVHVYLTPPSPAREIDFILEYDPSAFSGLFD